MLCVFSFISLHAGPGGAAIGAAIGSGAAKLGFDVTYGAVQIGVGTVAGRETGVAVAGTLRYICKPVEKTVTKIAALAGSVSLDVATGPL